MKINLIEMEAFLRGKCLPGDMKVNETNAEYLVRKFSELNEQLEESRREFRSADITMQNLEAKCEKMAAENAGLKGALSAVIDRSNAPDYQSIGMGCGVEDNGLQTDGYNACEYGWREAMERIYTEVIPEELPETPATDAFLAEVRAQGVEMFAKQTGESDQGNGLMKAISRRAIKFAAQLRKGVQS